MTFSIIVAMDADRGIGIQNTLPWRLKQELQHFKAITTNTPTPETLNVVIMGRNTWKSLPTSVRPLPHRHNIVVTSNPTLDTPQTAASLNDALSQAHHLTTQGTAHHTFVIGGSQLYAEAIHHPDLDTLYITHIHSHFNCDAFFPPIDAFKLKTKSSTFTENSLSYHFASYTK